MLNLYKSKRFLLKENALLEEQLDAIKRKYLVGNIVQKRNLVSSRDGFYSNIKEISNYRTKWKRSFFEIHQDIAETYSEGNLSSYHLDKYKQNMKDEYVYRSFVVLCSAVISSHDGPILYLEDPFGSIVSNPLKNTPLATAESWVNRILITSIGLHSYRNDYPINRIQTLRYSLYD